MYAIRQARGAVSSEGPSTLQKRDLLSINLSEEIWKELILNFNKKFMD
jgi:hypothetical protein